jgi:hypothetical protein
MPDQRTVDRARRDLRAGKSPTTAAGEFVREELHHVREGKHGARSTQQAIAIALSEARRAGVRLPAPRKGQASERSRTSARRALAAGKLRRAVSAPRSRAVLKALKREGHSAASRTALSRQTRLAAQRRGPAARSQAAKKASRTKGPRARALAARKGAHTRRS